MSDDGEKKQSDKKVVALRTFADDVKRARAAMGDADRSAAPETAVPEEMPEAEIQKEPAAQPPPPEPAPIPEKETEPDEKEEAKTGDEPLEAPPFHAIRASSPEDTSYGEEESEHIPDKESLRKETVRNTAPPKRSTVPSQGVEFDTSAIAEHAASVHSSEDAVFDAEQALEGGGEGTIVLDRKRKRFRLFPAIFSSIRKWFGSKKEQFEESRRPKHTVEKAERRKEVIEAASRKSRQAPRDDFAGVSKRLRNVERVTSADELQIRDEEAATPRWRYVEGADETPEEAEQPQRSLSSFGAKEDAAQEEGAAPLTEEAETVEEDTETAVSEQPEEPAPEAAATEKTDTGEPETDEPETPEETPAQAAPPEPDEALTPATEPLRSPESGGFAEYREKYGDEYSPREDVFGEQNAPPPPGEEASETRPRLQRKGVPEYRRQRAGQPRRETRPQGTPYLTMVAVVIAAIILGVGTTVWWFTRDSGQTATQPAPQTPALIDAQASIGVPLGSDREEFYTSLAGAIGRNAGGIVEFYPSVADTPVGTEQTFATLSWRAPGSMTRAVNSITFGGLNGEVPFIVMRFGSFDTVFAGMLAWEGEMSSDLAPLFGERTVTSSIDSRVNNRDIRVLVGPGGDDRIVYGFPDKNTLLITTNRNAYSTIAPEVQ